MQNKEVKIYLLLTGVVTAIAGIIGFKINVQAGILCLSLALLLIICNLVFILWRYKEIKKLSAALMRATCEGVVLDVRTNHEGELSILRNDLFKVTSALVAQAGKLRDEKLFLADALSDISHQMKTPLTSVMVLSELLQNEDLLPEKRREFLERITSQLERMRWLVSSLLKLSRIDAAVVVFRKEPIMLHKILSQAVEPLLTLAEKSNVAISIKCERALCWRGDAEWTGEAVSNLVKNCIEHAPNGGQVNISVLENLLNIIITVQDDGAGFKIEDIPHLFKRFYQGERPVDGGAGIGLAMAKTIMLSQGGEVSAKNAKEGGACFVLKLYK